MPIEERLLEEKQQIIVSGIRSIICIRLRPRSLMSSDSEPTASSGDWALDRLSSGAVCTENSILIDYMRRRSFRRKKAFIDGARRLSKMLGCRLRNSLRRMAV